jgi:hypothetical protein
VAALACCAGVRSIDATPALAACDCGRVPPLGLALIAAAGPLAEAHAGFPVRREITTWGGDGRALLNLAPVIEDDGGLSLVFASAHRLLTTHRDLLGALASLVHATGRVDAGDLYRWQQGGLARGHTFGPARVSPPGVS